MELDGRRRDLSIGRGEERVLRGRGRPGSFDGGERLREAKGRNSGLEKDRE